MELAADLTKLTAEPTGREGVVQVHLDFHANEPSEATSTNETLVERAVAALVTAGIGVLEVSARSSLEDVFAELTTERSPKKRRGKRS